MNRIATAGDIATSFRTLPRFRLVQAVSVTEAVAALAAADRPAVLAGGTDLPARFNEGFAPSVLVDVSAVSDLHRVHLANDCLVIGAAITHENGATHPLVRQHLPGFGAAWSRIANVRLRMTATLGGNVMARRTRYEGAILLTALDARLRFMTADGELLMPVEDLWNAKLPPGALLTELLIPLRPGLRLDYDRSLRPIMTQAVALDATGAGRIVTATEHAVPQLQPLLAGKPAGWQLHDKVFDDPITSDAYLNRIRRIIYDRQRARMEAA